MLNCANETTPKIVSKFYCEPCDFKCSKNSDYSRHLLTSKHNNAKNANPENADYICDLCSNEFKHASSLSRHKKKCKVVQNKEKNIEMSPILDNPEIIEFLINENKEFKNENKEFKNVIIDLMKSNSELQKQMLEVCKNGIVNNSTINSHNNNKTFNLQFFLNEQCKDAMNIMDFVNTFQLDFSDLERIGEVGYVEGISNIVIDKLNEMDVYKRPIHCSDAKREIMYVKDKDVWEKDNANNDKLRLALKHITKKNTDLIRPWAIAHPGVLNSDHRLSDKYQEMIIEAMGGNSGTMKECEAKIIKKISKMVLIDKSM
jgi:hypothetical protein